MSLTRPLAFAFLFFVAGAARADDAACVDASERSLGLRKQGKLHEALKTLSVCADPACPQEVKDECARRIGEIDAAMPSIIFAAKNGDGADLETVSVSVDGAPLLSTLDGRPVTLDPGQHRLRFVTPKGDHVEETVVVREGEKDRRESVVLGAPTPAPPKQPPPSSWNAQRGLALVSGGLGVVGIGLGAWFGGFAIASHDREKSDCPAPGCRDYLQASADYDTAKKDATASTIAFIAGGVLAATGVVLWLTAPRVHVAPAVGQHGAGIVLSGAFF